MELKDQKQCPKCYSKIDKKAKFCQECGEKQKEDEAKEVEILNRLEKVDITSDDEYKDEEQEMEEVKADEKQEETKPKVKTDEEQEEIDKISKDNLERTVEIESSVEENLYEEPRLQIESDSIEEPEYNVELGEDFTIDPEQYYEEEYDTEW